MLGKLIKYELKSTMRIFLSLYAVILGFSIIRRVLEFFNINLLWSDGILVVTYVLLIIAIVVLTFIVGIQRFYKNILGTEGYLMNTLPVKSWQLILSKLCTSVIWFFGSLIVTVSTVMIQLYSKGMIADIWKNIKLIWNTIIYQLGWQGNAVLAELIGMFLVYAFYGFLMVYCAMAIGHLFNTNRIIASFGAYIGLYFIVQMISTVVIFAFTFIFGGGLGYLSDKQSILPLITIQLIESSILGVIYFLVTNYIIKKRLNLE